MAKNNDENGSKNEKSPVEERIRRGVEQVSKRIIEEHEDIEEEKESSIEQVKAELEFKTKTLEEYTGMLKRLQAEFENYSKRVEKERQEFAIYASEKLILKLLHVLDSFEQALKNSNADDPHARGVKMIFEQFRSVLENEGLQRLKALNKTYNVEEHEAILTRDSEHPEHTVIEEVQAGYKIKNKVIRPAKVILSKSKQNIEGGK